MSMRNRLLIVVGIALVISVVLRYLVPGFEVRSPVVSVKAEPVLTIAGDGVHFGPAIFEGEGHHGGFVVTNAMLMALLTTIVLTILSLIATSRIRSGRGLVPTGFQNFVELAVDGMYNTFGSVDRKYIARFWPLVGGIFFYVLMSNWLALVPGVLSVGYRVPEAALHGEVAGEGEHSELESATPEGDSAEAHGEELVLVPYLRAPSADLNNTLMLGLIAFLFVEFWGFKELGLGYLGKFFPFRDGPVMIFAGLLEFISEFVRIISFAFRLFGNIFAGEVILLVMLFLFPLLPLPFLGLELFVGFIQAFVFAILVMAFASLATQAHGGHDDHGHGQPEHAELGGTTRQNPAH